MDASNLALLVPVSKHGKSRESYSTLQQYFSTSGCTVIFGLDEEDSVGRMALANEHVVTLMPGGALCTCSYVVTAGTGRGPFGPRY
jgi:hypothetical protein